MEFEALIADISTLGLQPFCVGAGSESEAADLGDGSSSHPRSSSFYRVSAPSWRLIKALRRTRSHGLEISRALRYLFDERALAAKKVLAASYQEAPAQRVGRGPR